MLAVLWVKEDVVLEAGQGPPASHKFPGPSPPGGSPGAGVAVSPAAPAGSVVPGHGEAAAGGEVLAHTAESGFEIHFGGHGSSVR